MRPWFGRRSGGRLVEIVEILGRSEQGRTRPFICRGDDHQVYFVKGRGAGRRSQLCEWTAAHLAHALRLPVANFGVVEIPAALLRLDMPHLDLRDLGAGPAFGSVRVLNAAEFSIGDLARVPIATRRDILAFDWWVRNDDRTLTPMGGNPNLLWDAPNQKVAVIDHNLAYTPVFDEPSFMGVHVFAADAGAVWDDLIERLRYQERFLNALPTFDQACDNAPEEWWFEDDSCGVPVNFDRAEIRRVLERCTAPDFWKTEP